jgi:hypothetical protein
MNDLGGWRPIAGLLALTLLATLGVFDHGRGAEPTPAPAILTSSSGLVDQRASSNAGQSRRARSSWDAASQAGAVTVARDGLSAYARADDVPPEKWWAALSPRLSPAAKAALGRESPGTGALTEVLDGGRVVSTPDTDLALTSIPTDVGAYSVLVSRGGPSGRWLIERITPPRHEGS